MQLQVNLKELFKGMQNQMYAQLCTNRAHITHPGSKGDALENVWIKWLKDYLPNRYSVDKAIVIDHNGQTSQQIDIVIYDKQYTPFVLNQNGFLYVPAEGVYAVFEVKPELSLQNIKYTSNKIASVRALHRTSARIVDTGQSRAPRSLTLIPGGIIVAENKIKNEKTILEYAKSATGIGRLDFGFAAKGKSFAIFYEKQKENLVKNTPEKSGKEKGIDFNNNIKKHYENRIYSGIEFSEEGTSLVFFLLHLLDELQKLGTVAAINLPAYYKTLTIQYEK